MDLQAVPEQDQESLPASPEHMTSRAHKGSLPNILEEDHRLREDEVKVEVNFLILFLYLFFIFILLHC